MAKANKIDPTLNPRGGSAVSATSTKVNNRDDWAPVPEQNTENVAPKIEIPEYQLPSSAAPEQSTFDKIQASKPDDANALINIYKAYKSGQMNDKEKTDYENAVKKGDVLVPNGGSLNQSNNSVDKDILPQGIIDAYGAGRMSKQESKDLEEELIKGRVKLPSNATIPVFGINTNNVPIRSGEPQYQGARRPISLDEIAQNAAQRKEEEYQNDHPILSKLQGAGEAAYNMGVGAVASTVGNAAGLSAGLLGAAAGQGKPADQGEPVANYVTQYIQNSLTPHQSELGQQYTENLGNALAPLPGMGAELGTLGEVAGNARAGLRPTVGNILKQALPEAKPQPVSPVETPAAPQPQAPMTGDQLAKTARAAVDEPGPLGQGLNLVRTPPSEKAAADLGSKIAESRNPETLESAKRLGVEHDIPEEALTTDQAVKDLHQTIKSTPDSELVKADAEGLKKTSEAARQVIENLGAKEDVSGISENVKGKLTDVREELKSKAKGLYKEVEQDFKGGTQIDLPAFTDFIKGRLEEVNGKVENLSPIEQRTWKILKPKEIQMTSDEVRAKMSELSKEDRTAFIQSQGKILPNTIERSTYSMAEDIRHELSQAKYKNTDLYKNNDSGMIKKLENLLAQDQKAALPPDLLNKYNLAQDTTRVQKGVENDIVGLFGKDKMGSIVGNLSNSITQLGNKNTAAMNRFLFRLKNIPEDMRHEVIASGLQDVFGKAQKTGNMDFTNYANWYENLLKNEKARNLIMDNLPTRAKVGLQDIYNISKGIRDAAKTRVNSESATVIKNRIKGSDSLIGKILNVGKKYSSFAIADIATGGHGLSLAGAVYAALKGKGVSPLKAVDSLLASREFRQATRDYTTGKEPVKVAKTLAYSKPFSDFVKSAKNPIELKDREGWILDALKVGGAVGLNNQKENK